MSLTGTTAHCLVTLPRQLALGILPLAPQHWDYVFAFFTGVLGI